jgi:pentatricopeptide repeat protein
VVSFNTLIKGFFREGKVEEAVGMVHEMTELGSVADPGFRVSTGDRGSSTIVNNKY